MQRLLKSFHTRNELMACGERGGDVERGREAVVRGLGAVDVVVGVDGRLAAALPRQQLVGAAGDHLVDVHVGLGARTGLPDHERKLTVELAGRDFGGGRLDRFGLVGGEAVSAFTRAAACFTIASAWTMPRGIRSCGPNGKFAIER